MKKIYKIVQYTQGQSGKVIRNEYIRIPSKTAYPNYGIGQIVSNDDLNLDFDSEDDAIAMLESKGFTDEELSWFSIELQIRN
jgi:hypothetical protein